jgi:hypothetical protein
LALNSPNWAVIRHAARLVVSFLGSLDDDCVFGSLGHPDWLRVGKRIMYDGCYEGKQFAVSILLAHLKTLNDVGLAEIVSGNFLEAVMQSLSEP